MRNFQRVAVNANVTPLLHAVMQKPWLWGETKVRGGEEDDIILRFPAFEAGGDRAKLADDLITPNYPAMMQLPQARPLTMSLLALVEGEHLGRCFITRLAPGFAVPESIDTSLSGKYFSRYYVVLAANPGCLHTSGEETVMMAPGEVWWIAGGKPMAVTNNSDSDNIILVVDIHTPDFTYAPAEPV